MKSEERMTTKTRWRFTDDFKAEKGLVGARLGTPIAQVARDLGIADHLLYRWRAEKCHAESSGCIRR